ncbi:unnamed protein product [Ambrosiozyma monospora]|uniref:Unnamed protein product n=1 Tax=Ambrosiozyma monospora TaxID=43982 RepID=A0ACB5SQV9_AMBMO|nr:unnamed protein product [Ambrosiozyma monospora]
MMSRPKEPCRLQLRLLPPQLSNGHGLAKKSYISSYNSLICRQGKRIETKPPVITYHRSTTIDFPGHNYQMQKILSITKHVPSEVKRLILHHYLLDVCFSETPRYQIFFSLLGSCTVIDDTIASIIPKLTLDLDFIKYKKLPSFVKFIQDRHLYPKKILIEKPEDKYLDLLNSDCVLTLFEFCHSVVVVINSLFCTFPNDPKSRYPSYVTDIYGLCLNDCYDFITCTTVLDSKRLERFSFNVFANEIDDPKVDIIVDHLKSWLGTENIDGHKRVLMNIRINSPIELSSKDPQGMVLFHNRSICNLPQGFEISTNSFEITPSLMQLWTSRNSYEASFNCDIKPTEDYSNNFKKSPFLKEVTFRLFPYSMDGQQQQLPYLPTLLPTSDSLTSINLINFDLSMSFRHLKKLKRMTVINIVNVDSFQSIPDTLEEITLTGFKCSRANELILPQKLRSLTLWGDLSVLKLKSVSRNRCLSMLDLRVFPDENQHVNMRSLQSFINILPPSIVKLSCKIENNMSAKTPLSFTNLPRLNQLTFFSRKHILFSAPSSLETLRSSITVLPKPLAVNLTSLEIDLTQTDVSFEKFWKTNVAKLQNLLFFKTTVQPKKVNFIGLEFPKKLCSMQVVFPGYLRNGGQHIMIGKLPKHLLELKLVALSDHRMSVRYFIFGVEVESLKDAVIADPPRLFEWRELNRLAAG